MTFAAGNATANAKGQMWKGQNCPFFSNIWPLVKGPEVAYVLYLHPQGVEIESVFTLPTVISEIMVDFKIATFGHNTYK